jgi:hypothetical protein
VEDGGVEQTVSTRVRLLAILVTVLFCPLEEGERGLKAETFGYSGPHYVAQAGLELSIFLPPSPKHWDYRRTPPYPSTFILPMVEKKGERHPAEGAGAMAISLIGLHHSSLPSHWLCCLLLALSTTLIDFSLPNPTSDWENHLPEGTGLILVLKS